MPYIALAMTARTPTRLFLAVVLSIAAGAARSDTATEVYEAQGIKPADVISGTVLSASIVREGDKQVVAVTTFFTGKREKAEAVDVRLDVLDRAGERLKPIYSRDFGEEHPGGVGNGDLQLIDLDRDGLNEIIVSFESYGEPLIEQRLGEVILLEGKALHTGWAGAFEYDSTRAARNVTLERRDRFRREIDFAETMRTNGITLFMNKTVISVAGERLPEPKVLRETFPLRPRKEIR